MNNRARAVLVEAALAGQHPVPGRLNRANGEGCTLQLLARASGRPATYEGVLALQDDYDLRSDPIPCPHACGRAASEPAIIAHMTDTHGDDYLTIATKLA